MSVETLDEDPCPLPEVSSHEADIFLQACQRLERQCDHLDEDGSRGVWRGVDVPLVAVDELPYLLGSVNEQYDGPFVQFCKKAVRKKGYRRLGVENEPLNLRLKIVSGQYDTHSVTILLQREYAGYDVSLEDGQVILSQLGRQPQVLQGERAKEIIDDIEYVATSLLQVAYHSETFSSKIQTCDSLAPLATSKESVTKPKRNLGMLVLRRFRT